MENETVCKFRSNIEDVCYWTLREYVSRQRKSEWNFLVAQLSTQINSVIQRYLRKLHKKSSVKIVQTDRNVTLNNEPLPLGWYVVLSGRCNVYNLVWFNVSKNLLCCTKYMHHLYYRRCCRLSATLRASHSSPFQNKTTTFRAFRGWRYCPAHLPSIHILTISHHLFEKLLSWQLGYVRQN